MNKRKPYNLSEIKTKYKGSEIRMASTSQPSYLKTEENGEILSIFEGKLIPVNILYSAKPSIKCEGRKMIS